MPTLTACPAISNTCRAILPDTFIFSISSGVFTSITHGNMMLLFLGYTIRMDSELKADCLIIHTHYIYICTYHSVLSIVGNGDSVLQHNFLRRCLSRLDGTGIIKRGRLQIPKSPRKAALWFHASVGFLFGPLVVHFE